MTHLGHQRATTTTTSPLMTHLGNGVFGKEFEGIGEHEFTEPNSSVSLQEALVVIISHPSTVLNFAYIRHKDNSLQDMA